ncbi:MAG TPA: nidogen-like domain-containing protein, partial [Solirubrobacteraceae bacterium]|nr:nidogen-like domain-containing protein [Solirubrobacteraceae bacterium]
MLARLLSSRRLWAVLASLLIAALVGGMAVSSADVGALLGYGYGGGDYGGGAPVTDYPFGGAVEDLAGCADHVLPANDDRSTAAVPLPFALDFLGDTYSSVYVNNNGNLTFRAPEPTYEPHDLAVGGVPMIAPFLADVDTRPAGSGVVTYGSTTVDGRPAFCVNWLRVGYFARHVDRRDSFQALLVASGSNGDFDIVFNYDEVAWEAGDASGGVDGLGGLAATAGWTSGDGVAGHHELLPGSATAGGLLDSNPSTGLIHGSRDSAQLGRYVFPVRNVPVETAAPAISGTAVQGQVLGVAHGTWTNDPTSYGYRWQRCDALGASCEPIDGATSPTYTLGDDDVGHTVVVEETATNAGGDSLPAASAPTAVVVALPPVEVAPPTVSGTAQEGRTLTEHHGSWTNRPVSFTYQWKRCAVGGGDCVAIAGATDDAYTATASDVGSVLVVEETAHNTGGASAPASSSATAAVLPAPPSPVSPPTISGVAIRGHQLSVEHGAWTNDPTSYGHQWQRCDALGAACQPIAGATGDAYTATASDVGHALRVQETAANAGGSSQPQTSAPTAIVVPSAPVNVSPPTITGIPRRGQTLTEHHGDWTDAPTGFTYRWERCDPGGGCVAIAGAVTAAYTLTASDVGHAIVVEETARNAQGTSDPATSEPTGTVSEAIARVTVTAQGGAPLSGASVVYVAADGTATSATTDGDGVASLSGLPDGDDTVYAWLSGYRPKVASVSVSGGSGDATVSLDPGDVGVATLVSHQLTPQEIEDAGIDTSDPDNQLVYGFDITLDYTGDPSLPHELCGNLNGAGQFVGGTAFGACGGGGGGGGASGCAGTSCHGSGGLVAVGTTIQGHPLIELLHLSGHATVLKQLFSVDMTVANLSGEPFDLTGGSATLSLPAGLSLAPTATPQSETQDVATVPGGGAVTTSWIVRG